MKNDYNLIVFYVHRSFTYAWLIESKQIVENLFSIASFKGPAFCNAPTYIITAITAMVQVIVEFSKKKKYYYLSKYNSPYMST